ncbi:hypothetical protein Tco_1010858 [Tanacetum coccineum]
MLWHQNSGAKPLPLNSGAMAFLMPNSILLTSSPPLTVAVVAHHRHSLLLSPALSIDKSYCRHRNKEKLTPIICCCLSVPLKGVDHTPLADTRSGRPHVYIPTLSSTTGRAIRRVESGSKKFLKPNT